ncbi:MULTISPECIES: uracil-DNA glycosylase [Jonquetella]|uniref:Type-4 uracil-DNA glycosylase n=1 Tax=Jonquetella anthropi DSM 22815 TaxID=885272 RepID=H0ULI1_9BACT|nr:MULTISPECIES: uracil-DNA glycosylase [Jonquetella]EHM12446.1 uracil-DNA glycosylase, family 4 [Jonquetella anthropi DSM 22815]ERL24805.1 putative uracil-DNA glycosylase A [Jonquetella sp. BV3C21]
MLARELAGCSRCGLRAGAKAPVFGSGPRESRVVLVGEAPGAAEDESGIPFVGASGRLLSQLLEESGLRRDELFITNAVKCRPPDNRTPQKDELSCCLCWLRRQLEMIRPDGIITVGNVPSRALLGRREGVTALRGRFYSLEIGGRTAWVRPIFHPAYLLRNRTRRPGSPILLTLEDLKDVACRVSAPAQSKGDLS